MAQNNLKAGIIKAKSIRKHNKEYGGKRKKLSEKQLKKKILAKKVIERFEKYKKY